MLKASPLYTQLPELGGAPDLRAASDEGGLGGYYFALLTPLLLLGRGVPHQLRVVASILIVDGGPGGWQFVDGHSSKTPDKSITAP